MLELYLFTKSFTLQPSPVIPAVDGPDGAAKDPQPLELLHLTAAPAAGCSSPPQAVQRLNSQLGCRVATAMSRNCTGIFKIRTLILTSTSMIANIGTVCILSSKLVLAVFLELNHHLSDRGLFPASQTQLRTNGGVYRRLPPKVSTLVIILRGLVRVGSCWIYHHHNHH